MKNNIITKDTIYDSRIFDKYVSFNFNKIAVERKQFLENSSFEKIKLCVPISFSSKINILQIIALRKANELASKIDVKILIKCKKKDGKVFKEKIQSKFNFKDDSFIYLNEINVFSSQVAPTLKMIKVDGLSEDIFNVLTFIIKFLYYLNNQNINSYLVGQNEAYLYEAIVELLSHKNKDKVFYPLYIPELKLFTKVLFMEGDNVDSISQNLLNILTNYRSIEGGFSDIFVLASLYNITGDNVLQKGNIVGLVELLAKMIYNDLTF